MPYSEIAAEYPNTIRLVEFVIFALLAMFLPKQITKLISSHLICIVLFWLFLATALLAIPLLSFYLRVSLGLTEFPIRWVGWFSAIFGVVTWALFNKSLELKNAT